MPTIPPLHHALRQCLPSTSLTDGQSLHILLQIQIQELKHQVQLMSIRMNDVEETHNVRVVHLFEQGDFADCGTGDAFIFGFETDFLEGYDAVIGGGEVAGFVDYAVGPCDFCVSDC